MSLLLASVPQDTVSLSRSSCSSAGFSSPQTATAQFNSNGTISGVTDGPLKWFNIAPQAGVGASYEIFATRIAGALPSGTMDTWLPLTSGQTWTLTQSATGEKLSTVTFKIRLAGSGSVMAQANFDMSAEVYSGS
jgi:hypothetical protein